MKYQTQMVVSIDDSSTFINLHPTVLFTYQNKKGVTKVTNIKLRLRVALKKINLKVRYKKTFRTNVNFRSQAESTAYSWKDLSSLFNLFTSSFLRKEKLYSKLKYSRSPQYDIVSGGVAALFSAFIGFLISEKFGIELVDSGDFFILFMYIVFITFSFKPLFRIVSKFEKTIKAFSLIPFFSLLVTSSIFVINTLNYFFRKLKTLLFLFVY